MTNLPSEDQTVEPDQETDARACGHPVADHVAHCVIMSPDSLDGGFVAALAGLTGVVAQGDSEAEALSHLHEALAATIEANRTEIARLSDELTEIGSLLVRHRNSWCAVRREHDLDPADCVCIHCEIRRLLGVRGLT